MTLDGPIRYHDLREEVGPRIKFQRGPGDPPEVRMFLRLDRFVRIDEKIRSRNAVRRRQSQPDQHLGRSSLCNQGNESKVI